MSETYIIFTNKKEFLNIYNVILSFITVILIFDLTLSNIYIYMYVCFRYKDGMRTCPS